jgi:hypothetical protein
MDTFPEDILGEQYAGKGVETRRKFCVALSS